MTGLKTSSVLLGAVFVVLSAVACLTVNTPAQQPVPDHKTSDAGEFASAELTNVAPTLTPPPTEILAPASSQTTGAPETTDAPEIIAEFSQLHSGPSIAELVAMVRPSLVKIQAGSSTGSGFIYTEDGLVITNAHVVDCCKWVSIFVENREYGGPVLGMDQSADIAVVRIDSDRHFHPVSFGSATQTAIGDEVIALGYPLSLGRELTATKGIISSKRTIVSYEYFQHDAPVNPGNSGGPLINFDGLVVGMNTGKIMKAEGIAFALSIREVDQRIGHLAGGPAASAPTKVRPQPTVTQPRPTQYPTATPIPTFIPPSQGNAYQQFDLGFGHGCAVKTNNSVVCWGKNDHGQASPPSGEFKEVNVGTVHSCGIKLDHSVECWGSNGSFSGTLKSSGRVVTGSYVGQSDPPSGRRFKHVEANRYQSCGILTNGYVECWGGFTDIIMKGETGTSFLMDRQPALPGNAFTQIDLGYGIHCGVQTNQKLRCWGLWENPPPHGEFKQVSANANHHCAIRTTGEIECWSNTSPKSFGLSIPPSGSFLQVSVGGNYTCAIRDDLAVVCWGNKGDWPFGINNSDYGQATPPSGKFVHVVATLHTSCALRTDGDIECFGKNDHGLAAPPAP